MPLAGHLILAPSSEDIFRRFHLLLMMGLDPGAIFSDLGVCSNYLSHRHVFRRAPVMVDGCLLDFGFARSLVFSMGIKPCTIEYSHLKRAYGENDPRVLSYRTYRKDDDVSGTTPFEPAGWCEVCEVYIEAEPNTQIHNKYQEQIISQTLFEKLYTRCALLRFKDET